MVCFSETWEMLRLNGFSPATIPWILSLFIGFKVVPHFACRRPSHEIWFFMTDVYNYLVLALCHKMFLLHFIFTQFWNQPFLQRALVCFSRCGFWKPRFRCLVCLLYLTALWVALLLGILRGSRKYRFIHRNLPFQFKNSSFKEALSLLYL